MLNIKNIKVSGFKNITETSINLSKMTGLLSVNNYGKSNLIKGIEFGLGYLRGNSLEREKLIKTLHNAPVIKSQYLKNFIFEITFEIIKDNLVYKTNYGFEVSWKNEESIISEYLKYKLDSEPKYKALILRNQNEAFYKPSIKARCDKEISVNNQELVIDKLLAYDDLYYLFIIKEMKKLKIYIDRHFDSTNAFLLRPYQNDFKTMLEEESITKILYDLKNNKATYNKYNLIKNTIMDLFPNIIDLEPDKVNLQPKSLVMEEQNMYNLLIKDKNIDGWVNAEFLSDGVKRSLVLLTYVSLADINNYALICIEELENSIHPLLFHKLLDVLSGFLENSKIILTSHSPYLINYLNLNNLYLGLLNNNGEALFKKVKSNSDASRIEKFAEDMGISVGEFLFRILSGTDDFYIDLLEKCFNDKLE